LGSGRGEFPVGIDAADLAFGVGELGEENLLGDEKDCLHESFGVVLSFEPAQEVAGGGRVGKAFDAEEIEKLRCLAQSAQVFGTLASGKHGRGESEDVVAFGVGAVVFEEIEMGIERLVESGGAGEFEKGGKSGVGGGTMAAGDFEPQSGVRVGGVKGAFAAEAGLQFVLALGKDLGVGCLHSKAS
jgi:hypothetical protein